MPTKIPWDKIASSKGKVTVQHGIKITLRLPSFSPHIEHYPFVVYYGEIGGQLAMEGASNITEAKKIFQSKVGIGKIAILKDAKGKELERIGQEHKKYQVYNRGMLWKELDSLEEAVELAKGLEVAGSITTVLRHPQKHDGIHRQLTQGEVVYETGMAKSQQPNIIPEVISVIPESELLKMAEE